MKIYSADEIRKLILEKKPEAAIQGLLSSRKTTKNLEYFKNIFNVCRETGELTGQSNIWLQLIASKDYLKNGGDGEAAYRMLAEAYGGFGKWDLTERTYRAGYTSGAIPINSKLKMFDKYIQGNANQINNHLNSSGLRFYASTEADVKELKQMIFLHVTRTGGHGITKPFWNALNLEKFWDSELYNPPELANRLPCRDYMAFNSIYEHEFRGLMPRLKLSQTILPDHFFLCLRKLDYLELFRVLSDIKNIKPTIFTTYRDPIKRLESTIRYFLQIGLSHDELDQLIQRKHLNFFNTYFDNIGINKGDSIKDFNLLSGTTVSLILDITNRSLMNNFMSSFLSTWRVPNIITNNIINNSPKKIDDDSFVESRLAKCIDRGFIEKDKSLELHNLMLAQQQPEYIDFKSINSLHPITLLYSSTLNTTHHQGKARAIPTKIISSEMGKKIINDFFQSSK